MLSLSSVLNWFINLFQTTGNNPMRTKIKILLISKSKNMYGCSTPASLSTGLFNSAKHVASALNKTLWADVKVVSVTDNNDIDREVYLFKPNVVIIEALWVVPEKFDILKKLHPTVQWIVRIHSETPFLAGEGSALTWVDGYLKRGIKVAPNISSMVRDLYVCFPYHLDSIIHLPNIYDIDGVPIVKYNNKRKDLHIGCFRSHTNTKKSFGPSDCCYRVC